MSISEFRRNKITKNVFYPGFTLVELLVVVMILAVLLTITLVAINPAEQLAKSRNAKRRANVDAILKALRQYASENKGQYPAAITSGVQDISSSDANICADLISLYVARFPVDPLTDGGQPITPEGCSGTYNTNYTVERIGDTIIVRAPGAELEEVIQVGQ